MRAILTCDIFLTRLKPPLQVLLPPRISSNNKLHFVERKAIKKLKIRSILFNYITRIFYLSIYALCIIITAVIFVSFGFTSLPTDRKSDIKTCRRQQRTQKFYKINRLKPHKCCKVPPRLSFQSFVLQLVSRFAIQHISATV